MFLYDAVLLQAAQTRPHTVAQVVEVFETIDAACSDADGLKWFNWLYLEVTKAVGTRVAGDSLRDPAWLAELDVRFAGLYLGALECWLAGQVLPACWRVLFERRGESPIARIQFALAGINAHINHDLAEAVFATCAATGTTPTHGSAQYADYTALNVTLEGIIDDAKKSLHVRLLGDSLPPVSHLEDTIAAWSVSAAREAAWTNAELLWHLRAVPPLSQAFLTNLDGLTAFAGQALLVPVP